MPFVPQIRGVVAPPGTPRENVLYWEDLFRRLTRTAAWEQYLAKNQFQEGYQTSDELAKFLDVFTDQLRGILKDAGVKTVR